MAAACGCTFRGGEPEPRQAVLVGRGADAIALDPARITDHESAEVCEQIFEHLVRRRPGSGDIEPELASSWEIAEGGTVWTFHLRPGVRFHDGTPFDADAVVFSFERQRTPSHPFHRADFAFESLFRNVASIEKVDPLTVRIVLEQSYAPFLANLSMYPLSIVSPAAVRRWGDDFDDHPVGTGPFRFVEWAHGERITLEANDDHWERPPRLRNLAFVPLRDARERLIALEGRAIDVAESIAPQDLQFVALHPELTMERASGHNVGYLAMNASRGPLGDERVRRAISHAINKDPIVKLVYQGLAVPATGPLPPSMWGHVDLPPIPYDPIEARRLLAEAAYPLSLRLKLYATSTARPYMPSPEQVARMIAQNLRDVGVQVDIVVNDMTTHLRATASGEHDLCLLGWSADNGDPDNVLYTLFHSDNISRGVASNLSFLRDGQIDGLLRWAQETLDPGPREELYQRAQRIIAERVPWVPLAHSEIVVARRRQVRGLALPPTSVLYFRDVAIVDER